LKAQVEGLEIDKMNREWDAMERYYEQQRKQREEEQQLMLKGYNQWFRNKFGLPDPTVPSQGNPYLQFEDRSPQQIIVQPDPTSERVKTELLARQQGYAIDWQENGVFGSRPVLVPLSQWNEYLAAKNRKQEDEDCHKEMHLQRWDHGTNFGKTFMLGTFFERNLGDRKAEVDATAKQIGARFYKLWEHHKRGDIEEVKVVFYK
jgi:hypothetical protein